MSEIKQIITQVYSLQQAIQGALRMGSTSPTAAC